MKLNSLLQADAAVPSFTASRMPFISSLLHNTEKKLKQKKKGCGKIINSFVTIFLFSYRRMLKPIGYEMQYNELIEW